MRVREDMNGDLKGQKVLKSTVHYFFTVLRLASITLILTFLFYQNMEEFLLMREPLDIVRISTALFVRVEQGEWTGVLEKEVKNFENVLERVLEQVSSEDIERIKKLRSFGTGKKLAKRVRGNKLFS
jgi:hypothetical protein